VLARCEITLALALHNRIYDLTKVKELIKGRENSPEFFPTPSCPFYNSVGVGSQSCYGDGEQYKRSHSSCICSRDLKQWLSCRLLNT